MKTPTSLSRRGFLKFAAGLAAIGGLGRAQAASVNDYKALVCIWLAGGNDGNNTIVPLDAPWSNQYAQIRGYLALNGAKLTAPIVDPLSRKSYALHYGLPKLRARHGNGMAFVLNTGVLSHPLTRARYLAGDAPANLFSHSDQTVMMQSGRQAQDGTGWGGRLLDLDNAATDSFAAIATSGPATLLQGFQVAGNNIPPGSLSGPVALNALNVWDQSQAKARATAVSEILAISGGNRLETAANQVFADGLKLAADMAASPLPAAGTLGFPATYIGQQMEQIARLILFRSGQGPGRQVFIATLGTFDTHSGQDWAQWNLLSQVDDALDAFRDVMQNHGLDDRVTSFSQSEFGRSLQPSGTGSDHGWGSHHFVAGGAVNDGIYGVMPDFTLGGADDSGNRGVWIPKISHVQFGATLGKWFGASDQELAYVFPELANFAGAEDVGFMKPVG